MWLDPVPVLRKGEGKGKSTPFSYENVIQKFHLPLTLTLHGHVATLVAKEAEECWNLRGYSLKGRRGGG